MYDALGADDGTWRDKCRAMGGVATVDPETGTPACRLPAAGGGWQYEDLRTLSEKIAYDIELAKERAAMAAGGLVDARDRAVTATGLDHGITGVAAKLTGIPRPVLMGALLVGGYAVGVAAGVLPPLSRLVRGK